MSLFLPSNLSPNFEEVIPPLITSGSTESESQFTQLEFKFQVNTNGSQVRSYKLEILNDKNDADVPDDNILATIYGVFDKPLYNKDIYTLLIDTEQIEDQMQLIAPKDYRWRIRLYEDDILQ